MGLINERCDRCGHSIVSKEHIPCTIGETKQRTPKYRFYPFTHEGVVKAEGNKAVRLIKGAIPRDFFCGYCVFHKDELPRRWRYSKQSRELQYLQIHVGITFFRCETNLLGLQKLLYAFARRMNRLKTPLYALCRKVKGKDALGHVSPIYAWVEGVIEGVFGAWGQYLVFGFDCNHIWDERETKTQNLDYVWQLTIQMENQIRALAKRDAEFQRADKAGRFKILDEVRETATMKTEFGVGAMLGILSGGNDVGGRG